MKTRALLRFAFVALAAAAARAATAEAPVVMMSPYEVTADSIKFEKWVKIASPNYTLYTDAEPKEALAIAREMEMLHVAVQRFFRREAMRSAPAIVVMPTSRSDWRQVESKGLKVEWRVAVSQTDGRAVDVITEQHNWQLWGREVMRAALGRREMRRMNLRGPFWFGRGVGTFFQTAEFQGETVILGEQHSRTTALLLRGWIPWERFFKIDGSSPEFTDRGQVARLDGQCAAFIQYALTHPDPAWFDRLLRWAALQEAGREPTEAAFQEIFGQDWKTWQKTMEDHRRNRRKHHVSTLRVPPEDMGAAPVRVDLPVREMRELFVLSQILNQRVPASERALDALLAKGVKSPGLRDMLIEACVLQKRWADVLREARKQIADGSTNPAIYALAGQEMLQQRIPPIAIHARLGGADAEEVRAWSRQAIALAPLHPGANNVFGWSEAFGPTVTAANVAAIDERVRVVAGQFPTSDLMAALMIARWRMGEAAAARSLAIELKDSPYANKRAKDLAEAILRELGPGR